MNQICRLCFILECGWGLPLFSPGTVEPSSSSFFLLSSSSFSMFSVSVFEGCKIGGRERVLLHKHTLKLDSCWKMDLVSQMIFGTNGRMCLSILFQNFDWKWKILYTIIRFLGTAKHLDSEQIEFML